MNRFKRWLCERYLPAYCKEELTRDNFLLGQTVDKLKHENDCLRSYVKGLEKAMRMQHRTIVLEGVKPNGND